MAAAPPKEYWPDLALVGCWKGGTVGFDGGQAKTLVSHRGRRSGISDNGAWLAVPARPIVTTKTLRRRVFALVGRITRSARRLTLHLPRRWPWEEQFSRALARLRAIPLPT